MSSLQIRKLFVGGTILLSTLLFAASQARADEDAPGDEVKGETMMSFFQQNSQTLLIQKFDRRWPHLLKSASSTGVAVPTSSWAISSSILM